MPVLLKEDWLYPLPKMHKVRQHFKTAKIENVVAHIEHEMRKEEIRAKLRYGARVAVAVGSRGIRNISLIVKTVIDELKLAGCRPFIISAMGSHGGGTPEGQRAVLDSYGINEVSMGVEIVTSVDVEKLGTLSDGAKVYFDAAALKADLIIPINRVKLHTDFVADIQSGICKMLVIGLGNHIGCTAMHEINFDKFGDAILEAAAMIIDKANVGFGLAILENACDETAYVEAIPAEHIIVREKELVKVARDLMPVLRIPDIDILIVEEIGKNISGAGYDPNILGKSYLLKEFVLPVPQIKRMVLLDITEETHGNAIGMGVFDVITRQVFDKLDLQQIYANAIAVKCPEDAKIPIIAETEEEAVRIAVQVAREVDRSKIKIVKIKNTIELETIEVSDALVEYVKSNPQLKLLA